MSASESVLVNFRAPKHLVTAVDALADQYELTRSALLRRFVEYSLESNMHALALEAQIDKERSEIKDRAKPIDMAGGFPKRVKDDFEERFKNEYAPKWLVAKAESYREEARMLEEKLPKHPECPDIEPGELVEEVDRVLVDSIEASRMSDWSDRYDNDLERLEGVDMGTKDKKAALALTKRAVEIDRDYITLSKSASAASRRVRWEDLPDKAESVLPPEIEPDALVSMSRELVDQGVTADQLPDDPHKLPLFADDDVDLALEAPTAAEDHTPAIEPATDPETDGGTSAITDGSGDRETPAQTVQPVESGTHDSGTTETEHMELNAPTTDEMIDELADFAAALGPEQPATAGNLYRELKPSVNKEYARRCRWDDLDKDDVVDRALEAAKEGDQ